MLKQNTRTYKIKDSIIEQVYSDNSFSCLNAKKCRVTFCLFTVEIFVLISGLNTISYFSDWNNKERIMAVNITTGTIWQVFAQ